MNRPKRSSGRTRWITYAIVWVAALTLAACGGNTAPDGGQPCSDDFECGIGEYCRDGICAPIGGDEDVRTCGEDSECREGEICEGGVCTPGERLDGGPDAADGDQVLDGSDASDGGDTTGPAPDILLSGDVITTQDAQGVVYEINFGNVTMGVPVGRNLTILNAGDADLEITVVTLSDDPDAEFGLDPQVPPSLTIAPQEERTIAVDYSAADGLTDRATVSIFSNDPDEGQLEVQLISEFKGDVAIAVDPATLDFGDVPVGQGSMLPLTIANAGTGNAVLRIDEVLPEATIATAYSVELKEPDGTPVAGLPAYINRGDFLTAEVTFLAPARDSYEGNLVITSSDEAASPTLVPVRGRAGAPIIEVDPASIDFGQAPTNEWAPDQQVTIRNLGVGDLTVSAIDLTPTGDLSLDGVPGLPLVVPAAGQAQFQVRYFPSDTGQDTATLSISHDDLDQSSIQIPVGGEGVQGNARPTALIEADGVDTAFVQVELGDRVNLDGANSTDSDGTVNGYAWRIIQQPVSHPCGQDSTMAGTMNSATFIILREAGLTRIGLVVTDDLGADSDEDILDIQVGASPLADLRQAGNTTGFTEIDLDDPPLTFNGTFSSDCDGIVTDYQWSIVDYPIGRGGPPPISSNGEFGTIDFDFPGLYTVGLTVLDNDVPQNASAQVTFDVNVRGPKAFRVTADWYDQGNEDHHVDVDIHLLNPNASDDWGSNVCCPKDGAGGGENCNSSPNWGSFGNPAYQTDGLEDDGLPPGSGAPGDEINLSNPGMGIYTIKVHFRCHSSTPMFGCCDEGPFPCPFPFSFCADLCSRVAHGDVAVYVTDYNNNETLLVSRPFHIDGEDVFTFNTIGTLSWPDGNFQ